MSSNNRFCNECKMCCHKKQLKAIQKAATWIKEKLILSRRRIFHYAVLIALTWYVLSNWETCISMQFFSRFDGNNILFLVWIILIVLVIYNIKIGDNSVFDRDMEANERLKQNLESNDIDFIQAKLYQEQKDISLYGFEKGVDKNESTTNDGSAN